VIVAVITATAKLDQAQEQMDQCPSAADCSRVVPDGVPKVKRHPAGLLEMRPKAVGEGPVLPCPDHLFYFPR